MKIHGKKRIIITVTAVSLAVICGITSVFAQSAGLFSIFNSKSTSESSSPYNLDMSDIEYNPNAKREDYDNNLEYLLARDGFIYGVDYAWQGQNLYSDHSLGAQHIFMESGGGATFNKFVAYNDIYNMRALGFNATNYWLLPSMNGVTFDEDGYCTGLDEDFKQNLRDLLEICREVDMMIIPTLQPHGFANAYGTINEHGEAPQDVWNKYFKYIWHDGAREAYMTNVIDPILEILKEYEDIILLVGITIENSNSAVNDVDYGYVLNDYGTSWENWANWHNAMVDRVKMYMPNMLTSTEEAGGTDKLYRYNDLNVDILGANFYHSTGYVKSREDYFTERPGYVGECNIADGACDYDISGEPYGSYRQRFHKSAKEGGWLGAFLFQWCAEGDDCNLFETGASTLDYEALYYWMVEFRKIFTDELNEYRGITSTIDKPYLFANKGTTDVFWTPSVQAVNYKLERSLDGGNTWVTLSDAIDPDNYSAKNSMLHFVDDGIGEGDAACYRVTAYNEAGESAVSDVNNVCEFYVAENIVKNYSFEDNGTNGNYYTAEDWNLSTECVVTDEDASDGEYSIKLDWSDTEVSKDYHGLNQSIKLKPSTSYTIQYTYKATKSPTGTGEAPFVRVREYESRKETSDKSYIWSETKDESGNYVWIQSNKVKFTTGSVEDYQIDISFGARSGYIIYIDEIIIKEMR